MKKIGLAAVGSYVPEEKLTNGDLEKMVDTSNEWITSRTGIKERRIAPNQMHASDLAAKAAADCLAQTYPSPSAVAHRRHQYRREKRAEPGQYHRTEIKPFPLGGL